jgi:hypothetical protein
LTAPATLRAGVVLAVLALAMAATAAERAQPVAVGERAPSIELGDQHGATFKLAEALTSHRFVVLAFYPKAFTGG